MRTDTFNPRQKMYVGVKNLSKRALNVELIWLGAASADKPRFAFVVDRRPGGSGLPVMVAVLKPNEEIHFPDGDDGDEVNAALGEDQVTILAANQLFSARGRRKIRRGSAQSGGARVALSRREC